MANTIILPDHISLEEIAGKWCSLGNGRSMNGMIYDDGVEEWSFVFFYRDENTVFESTVLTVDMKTREVKCCCEITAKPILNYIKERSHG